MKKCIQTSFDKGDNDIQNTYTHNGVPTKESINQVITFKSTGEVDIQHIFDNFGGERGSG